MIREFYLQNANGQILNLNDFDFEFLHSVKGLGFSKNLKVKQVGSHFEVVKVEQDMQTITGSVHFTAPNAYSKYFDFVQFCAVSPLVLIYNPEKFTQSGAGLVAGYRRDCILTKADKSGYTHGFGEMSVPVEFTCLSPWYKNIFVQTTPQAVSGTKAYSDTEYAFPITFSSSKKNTVEVISDSRLETGSPCRLRIFGPITNPSWTLYVNNISKITGSVTATIPAENYVEIDTINGRSIKQYNGNGQLVRDLYQWADFNTIRFITLGQGKNRVTVRSQNGEDVVLNMEAHIEYDSV